MLAWTLLGRSACVASAERKCQFAAHKRTRDLEVTFPARSTRRPGLSPGGVWPKGFVAQPQLMGSCDASLSAIPAPRASFDRQQPQKSYLVGHDGAWALKVSNFLSSQYRCVHASSACHQQECTRSQIFASATVLWVGALVLDMVAADLVVSARAEQAPVFRGLNLACLERSVRHRLRMASTKCRCNCICLLGLSARRLAMHASLWAPRLHVSAGRQRAPSRATQ